MTKTKTSHLSSGSQSQHFTLDRRLEISVLYLKMRGRLVVHAKLLKDHFLRQQRGGNIAGFRGARMQRGYGIGGIFKSLARYAIPLFKQGAKVVGKRALQTATEVDQDILQGKNVREYLSHEENKQHLTLQKTLPRK